MIQPAPAFIDRVPSVDSLPARCVSSHRVDAAPAG